MTCDRTEACQEAAALLLTLLLQTPAPSGRTSHNSGNGVTSHEGPASPASARSGLATAFEEHETVHEPEFDSFLGARMAASAGEQETPPQGFSLRTKRRFLDESIDLSFMQWNKVSESFMRLQRFVHRQMEQYLSLGSYVFSWVYRLQGTIFKVGEIKSNRLTITPYHL